MSETEKLLRAALFALNAMPGHRLKHPDFQNTYALASAIEKHLETAAPDLVVSPQYGSGA